MSAALQPLSCSSTLSGERYVNEAPLKLIGQRMEVTDESPEKPVSAACFKPAAEWAETRPKLLHQGATEGGGWEQTREGRATRSDLK